ncbi:DUF2845 domain-containing protein [Undibacterium sp. SXout20W]
MAWLDTLVDGADCMAASSDTFRCKKDVVRIGEDKASVSQKCWEP